MGGTSCLGATFINLAQAKPTNVNVKLSRAFINIALFTSITIIETGLQLLGGERALSEGRQLGERSHSRLVAREAPTVVRVCLDHWFTATFQIMQVSERSNVH